MSGVGTVLHSGERDGDLVIERVQDCTPIAEHTTRLRNEGKTGTSEMKLAASLPMVLIERYCNDRGITFEDWMKNPEHARAMLNDPALSAFRVWEGRVG